LVYHLSAMVVLRWHSVRNAGYLARSSALRSRNLEIITPRIVFGAGSQMLQRRCKSDALGVIFHGVGQPFELREMNLPDSLDEGELVVKLDVATICGSDLHTVSGLRREPMPLILGHEGVGVVERIGRNIFAGNRPRKGSVKEGDRITFSVADSCGTCLECTLHKLPQKCVSLMKYGHARVDDGAGLNGTYASHIIVRPGTHVVKLPDSLSSRVCAPANCALATVVNSLDMGRLPRYGSNNSAVVQGAGLLGIYAVAWLRYRVGMEQVFCFDPSVERLETAKRFGAIPVLVKPGEDEAHARAQLVRKSCPRGVDVVVEMTGAKVVLSEGVQLLRNGGHYAFAGMVHPDSQLSSLTGETIIRKCLTIRGAHNYTPWNLQEAVAFLKEFQDDLPFDAVLSPEDYSLHEIDKAFELANAGKHCRVVVNCQK
jgi:putative phosphonate catabolism associated alcohol dehydrogenase